MCEYLGICNGYRNPVEIIAEGQNSPRLWVKTLRTISQPRTEISATSEKACTPAGKIMMIAFRSPPSSIATSQPQHATDQKARMCLSCFLRDEPTALICQILLFLAAGAPFRCHRQNHHPSPRSTAPPRFRVRGPSFDALDRAHLKARRHSASSLSGTAAHRHAPGHEDARSARTFW